MHFYCQLIYVLLLLYVDRYKTIKTAIETDTRSYALSQLNVRDRGRLISKRINVATVRTLWAAKLKSHCARTRNHARQES